MNKKLIAAAVSAAVVAPVAAQAEVSVYGRINNAIDIDDLADGGDSSTHLSTVSSRFGVKYDQDIGGSGYTAHGKYEFSTTTDREKSNDGRVNGLGEVTTGSSGGVEDVRVATAGISGPFGRVDIGNQWSAYFNTFGTLISPTYSLGYYLYSSIGQGPFRASNTIKYSNTFGPVYAELDVRLNDDSNAETGATAEKLNGDGVGIGISFSPISNLTIAVAYDSEDGVDDEEQIVAARVAAYEQLQTIRGTDPTVANAGDFIDDEGDKDRVADVERIGVGIRYTYGDYWVNVGWQNYESDDLDAVTVADGTSLAEGGTGVTDGDTDPDEIYAEAEGADIDTTMIYFGGKFSDTTSWMLGFGEADDGDDDADVDDSEQNVWAIYHNLGGGLRLFYEAVSVDSETAGHDGTRQHLGMRVDF